MTKIAELWTGFSPKLRSILRIAAAFTFTLHGTMKLFAFPAGMGPGGMTVHLFSQMGLAGILETIGGLLLLFGLFTRPVAVFLAGEMAGAVFQVHFPRSFWPIISGGELAMVYCFVWLYFSTAGAGPWSADEFLRRRRERGGGAD